MSETLAALVRKKYPGAYDDLSDADLEAKVDAKYPGAYADLPRSARQDAPRAAPGATERPESEPEGVWARGRRTAGQIASGDVSGAMRTMGEGAVQGVTGAAKGAANMVLGLNRVLAGREGPLTPANIPYGSPGEEAGGRAAEMLAYAVPGGPVRGLAGAAAQAGRTAVTAAAQGERDPRALATAAGFGAAGPLTAKVGEVAGSGLRKAAEIQYGRALAATTKANKATSARIVPELLDRGVVGTLEGLAEKGAAKSGPLGRQIRQAYEGKAAAGVEISTAPIMKKLGEIKQRYVVRGKAGQTFSANPGATAKVEAVEELVGKFGDSAPPDELWKLRQNIDDIITSTGTGFADIKPGTAKWLQSRARTAIQEELNKAVPDMAKLNARFSLWKGLEDVAKATTNRRWGQTGVVELGIRTTIGGGAGALLGEDSRVWAPVGAMLGAVTKHPLYRTVQAVNKARVAHAMSKGNAAEATSVLTRTLAELNASADAGLATRQPTPTP